MKRVNSQRCQRERLNGCFRANISLSMSRARHFIIFHEIRQCSGGNYGVFIMHAMLYKFVNIIRADDVHNCCSKCRHKSAVSHSFEQKFLFPTFRFFLYPNQTQSLHNTFHSYPNLVLTLASTFLNYPNNSDYLVRFG